MECPNGMSSRSAPRVPRGACLARARSIDCRKVSVEEITVALIIRQKHSNMQAICLARFRSATRATMATSSLKAVALKSGYVTEAEFDCFRSEENVGAGSRDQGADQRMKDPRVSMIQGDAHHVRNQLADSASGSIGNDPPSGNKYFLRSRRLGFRPWSDADIGLADGLWGDPEVTRFIGGPFSNEKVRERLAREIATQREHGMQYWPMFLLGTGEHVGCCGLRPYKLEDKVHELGFHIRKLHWGQGYAQEAAQTVIGYAFEMLAATALFAGHNPANESSRHLLLKLGFEYTHDEFYAPTGLYHPSYLLRAVGSSA